MSNNDEQTSWGLVGYILLFLASIALLVVGLAPIGLLLILRAVGLDLSFVADWNGMAFLIFGLIIIAIVVLPKTEEGRKKGVWIICLLAILNMGGCVSLSGLKDIGKTIPANKSLHPTESSCSAKFLVGFNH